MPGRAAVVEGGRGGPNWQAASATGLRLRFSRARAGGAESECQSKRRRGRTVPCPASGGDLGSNRH